MMRFTTMSVRRIAVFTALAGTLSFGACKDDTTNSTPISTVSLKNHSTTPALVKNVMPGVEVFSLIGSDDKLAQSPAFVFGGSADGAGLLKNSDGTFTYIVNHEDNFSVSRITLDNTFKPVKGEYIVNSDAGQWRLCSATMATPEEHGFGPVYLTCGETDNESMIHAVNPTGAPNTSRILSSFGRWCSENAVPLPKVSYPGKTVVIIGDDDSRSTATGQVAMYLSNTVGDLDNGSLYALARTDNNQREMDMVKGQSYPIEFRKIDNPQSLTGAQINTLCESQLKTIGFGRVEDVDYRKGNAANGREIFFTVTGMNYSGNNADKNRTKYGRIYRLVLNENDPTKGNLEVILDGDIAGAARSATASEASFQDPDNICVTTNYVYIQEDPNGYGDETHDAYIYQYNLATKELKLVMELDHRRTATDAAKYNVGGTSKFGTWEYGAMIDVSDQLGVANTFMLCIQPHTWTGDAYKNPDGGTKRPTENQASQILILKGLPR
jgi:hypothetical protein